MEFNQNHWIPIFEIAKDGVNKYSLILIPVFSDETWN